MQSMGLNELREKYLAFFESKEHLRLPSFSLVPQGDKSLLLINAGMAPMKKYFTGEVTPPAKRVTTCQKCIRTPDIERVGITARHGTYFEMLGNFSFGDYFKNEATAWAWEFFTKVLEIPEDKLWVSIYEEDDEAFDVWTKRVGVSPDRIVRLGKEDNFWEHGAGPCGPCSEIYFDRGEKYGCGSETCGVGCDCDRYTEVWNLVFTQFDNDGNGNYTRLENCNIDTGMGLERLACVMQDVGNLFEVDTIRNIMQKVIEIAGVEYHEDEKKDISLRVITDHIRSTTFMLSDGVMPSNEGRGYVLRRLLRRAARHGKLLGIDGAFLYEICDAVIEENKNAYPNLLEKRDLIIRVIKAEEESFAKTIDTGLSLLESMIEKLDGGVLSGEDAFKLSDTYGFPIDLTKELLAEKNLSVDEAAFAEIVKLNRERTRAARKDAGAEAWKGSATAVNDIAATEFVGYEKLESEAEILAIISGGERAEFVGEGEGVLILNTTPFYAESGGQVGDCGTIECESGTFEVTDTKKTPDGVYMHSGKVISGALTVGSKVNASVFTAKREATMRNHTAAHLLQGALRSVLGSHVEQAGSFVNDKECRFDFVHFSAMTSEEIEKVERLVNENILKAAVVTTENMDIEQAKAAGAMALFGEKYGKIVRVVKAGDFSTELCGGTHVDNTGKIGLFKIVSETSVAAGVRRITAYTGNNSLEYVYDNLKLINNTAVAMRLNGAAEIDKKAAAIMAELKAKEKEIEKLAGELASMKTASLAQNSKEIGSLKLVATIVNDTPVDELRRMADTVRDMGAEYIALICGVQTAKGSGNICVACGAEAVKAGAHAGNIARAVAQLAGGSGGGKPDAAMAGAKQPEKLPDAVAAAEEIIAGMIG